MATSSLLYSAETWEKAYRAFEEINFTAYDYDAVKQSLLDYLKIHYPENFNDYIESSQMIALVEMFAYISEQLAYRVDLSVHENLMPSASRKQSILRLAKLISYSASRNLPLRGLVKITSISVSENLTDSQGNSITNRQIKWDDQNNLLWREQFFAAANKVLTSSYGNPFKSFQIDDTVFQQYEVKNVLETDSGSSSFKNGVIKTKVNVNGSNYDFEIVPSDVDSDGIFEREPNLNSYFSILYADDGYGDGSDTTGFMMYMKQGSLQKLSQTFELNIPNRSIDINLNNINDVDVWVQKVDANGLITESWENVPSVAGTNLAFNNIQNMNKYEIETLEGDQIRLIFGDGDFATIPTGMFNIWVRQSTSGNITVPKSLVKDETMTFLYTSSTGSRESCTFTYSLVSALQNSAVTENAEHIRNVAPSVYYTQNRMVNGQDYNSYLLKDPSILRLKAINRTFAGQPKYINWNDASGAYQNVKIFGDDLRIYYDLDGKSEVSTVSSRSLIDNVLEPALSNPGIYNTIIYAFYKNPITMGIPMGGGSTKMLSLRPFVRPRLKFIEDSTQVVAGIPLQEKTLIQGALDRHWYGEPDSKVTDSGFGPLAAVVNGDTDHLIYDSNLKCVIKDPLTGAYSLIPTPRGISGIQEDVNRQKKFGIAFNPTREFASGLTINTAATSLDNVPSTSSLAQADVSQLTGTDGEVFTVEITDIEGNFTVYSSISGVQPPGVVGVPYTNGIINFLIAFPGNHATGTITPGDAFLITVNANANGFLIPRIVRLNLTGYFSLIEEEDLEDNAETQVYDPSTPGSSWIFIIERTDDEDGNVSYWTITSRDFSLIIESPTTKFWYNSDMALVDSETKKPVTDMIRILKSNLVADGSKALGIDQVYNVVGDVKHPNGETNYNALSITPSTIFDVIDTSTSGTYQDPLEFLSFVGDSDYVYFTKNQTDGSLTPIEKNDFLENLTYVNDESGNYVRKLGREGIDFMWQHFTPDDHLIDPSTSNIIDIFVLTRGYYSQVQDYVKGLALIEPTPETSLDLRNSYRKLLENKMISDTVVLHSAKVKLLFGSKAIPELRVKFRVVQSPDAKLTGDQIRARILAIINNYFKIENWDFGQEFFATELCAVIHKNLPTEISSVVMIPEFPTNYFGDLFYIRSAPNEIFVSCAGIENIELVSSIDRLTLKQKQ